MKHFIYLLILLATFSITSCETDIPENDDTAPEFSFKITGDGFSHTFDQDDDFENFQLNLRADAEYNFILTGSDQGGVEVIQWQLPSSDYIEFVTSIPNPWTISNISILTRMIQWQGDENNPLTGSILNGPFEANGQNIILSFGFYVSDFGGESGSSNTVSKELNLYIGNHNTEIIEF